MTSVGRVAGLLCQHCYLKRVLRQVRLFFEKVIENLNGSKTCNIIFYVSLPSCDGQMFNCLFANVQANFSFF